MLRKYIAEIVFVVLILTGILVFTQGGFHRLSNYEVAKVKDSVVDTSWRSSLRSDLNSLLNRKHLLGFNGVLAVQIGDDFHYEGKCGYANHLLREEIQSNTRFQIGSVSKQFTAVAILQLYANGQLRLTDSISEYFPDLHFQGFTIHDLLVHRSGLSNYIYFIDKIVKDKGIVVTNNDVLRLWNLHKPLTYYPPGKRFDYSNSGYMLLASVVEKVSGVSYPEYLQQYVFKPLRMTESFVCTGLCDTMLNVAQGYSNRWHIVTEPYLNGTYGDKGIYATAADIIKWDQGLYKGTILPLDTLNLAFRPMGKTRNVSNNYGYGWRISQRNGVDIFYHAGWWQGFKSILIRIPAYKITIVVLKNTKVGVMFSRHELLRLIIDKYLESPKEALVIDLPQFQKCIIPDNAS